MSTNYLMVLLTRALFGFTSLFSIACYIMSAIGLYSIAKNNHVDNPWIAFIPIVQFYIIGKMIREYQLFGHVIGHTEWIIVLLSLIETAAAFIPIFGFLIGLAANILRLLLLHKFFYLFDPGRALLYTILCILGSLPLAIILLVLKNKQSTLTPGTYQYPFR